MIQNEIYTLLGAVESAYYLAIPQRASFPAIRFARISSSRAMNFDEVENFVSSNFQVDAYAKTYDASLALAESVKAALNDYSGGSIQKIRLDSELDTLEDATDLYRVFQQFTVWHTE